MRLLNIGSWLADLKVNDVAGLRIKSNTNLMDYHSLSLILLCISFLMYLCEGVGIHCLLSIPP